MEDFYLKYESGYGKLNKSLMQELIEKWIDGLTEEIEILAMLKSEGLGEDYDQFIQILEIIANQFIEYSKEILRHIDLFSEQKKEDFINDSSLAALVCFLKDNYNSILVIIEKIYSVNINLQTIRQELIKTQNCINLPAKLMKIHLKNDQLKQLIIETNYLKEAQLRQRYNFSLLNKKGYPTIKEMNELCNQYKENQSAQKEQYKRLYGTKAISAQHKKPTKSKGNSPLKEVSILHHYQGRELGITVNNCKELSKEIDEKMKKYCVCYHYPNAIEQIQNIKKDNIKIEDNISYAKTEIKGLIKGIKELTTRIEQFEKESNDIIMLNNTINQQIQNKNKSQIQNNQSPFMTWNNQSINNNRINTNNLMKNNSNQSIVLITSEHSNHSQKQREQLNHGIQRNNSAFNYPTMTLTDHSDCKLNTFPENNQKRYLLTKK